MGGGLGGRTRSLARTGRRTGRRTGSLAKTGRRTESLARTGRITLGWWLDSLPYWFPVPRVQSSPVGILEGEDLTPTCSLKLQYLPFHLA